MAMQIISCRQCKMTVAIVNNGSCPSCGIYDPSCLIDEQSEFSSSPKANDVVQLTKTHMNPLPVVLVFFSIACGALISHVIGFSHESGMMAGACFAASLTVGFKIPFFKLPK
jgi:hypothetical protein